MSSSVDLKLFCCIVTCKGIFLQDFATDIFLFIFIVRQLFVKEISPKTCYHLQFCFYQFAYLHKSKVIFDVTYKSTESNMGAQKNQS